MAVVIHGGDDRRVLGKQDGVFVADLVRDIPRGEQAGSADRLLRRQLLLRRQRRRYRDVDVCSRQRRGGQIDTVGVGSAAILGDSGGAVELVDDER